MTHKQAVMAFAFLARHEAMVLMYDEDNLFSNREGLFEAVMALDAEGDRAYRENPHTPEEWQRVVTWCEGGDL